MPPGADDACLCNHDGAATMNRLPSRLIWAALCLATAFSIGTGAALHALAKHSPPTRDPPHAATGVDTDADCELNPRWPC
jgi:hypothetical protein